MKIYEFINSRDIREHWEKIGYEPSALESAWLVWQSKNHTLEEKHTAWNYMIDNCEDRAIPAGLHDQPQPSLHEFLKKYTEIELSLISAFYKEEPNAVYSYREYFDDDGSRDWYSEPALFHTFEDTYAHAKGDGEPPHPNFVEFVKTYVGREVKQIFVRFNLKREIVRIDESNYLRNEKDYEIFQEVFRNMWFSFPTPFKKGDIVKSARGKYTRPTYLSDTFVLTSICTESDSSEYLSKICDGSDMTAYGYFIGKTGEVYCECIHNYMDLEYVRQELYNEDRLLIPISNYLKGNIDLALLLGAQRIMLCENEAKIEKRLLNYTKDGFKLAGIEK